jgi:hypothetical protein
MSFLNLVLDICLLECTELLFFFFFIILAVVL